MQRLLLFLCVEGISKHIFDFFRRLIAACVAWCAVVCCGVFCWVRKLEVEHASAECLEERNPPNL